MNVLGEELRVLPSGDAFTRPLGTNYVFTCEIYRLGPQSVDINLQWYDKDGREIRDTAGPGRLDRITIIIIVIAAIAVIKI